ncbi:protein trichome birefringence-like 25 isoform X1 [Cicer arietinum]|uniref:Protein trichome birefringence-like 25 isoform X1 n=1 Tax=Cicer arietinum TaxID=3827 RepID=A0A1S2Z7G4_CICAR|nr:protein trichome birefringence-like 25 isoform X1 [Cicer arietinum]
MVKKIRSENFGPFSLQNHNLVCVKFAAAFFLVGFGFRLLLWDSFTFSFVLETQTQTQTPPSPPLTETKAESSVVSSLLKTPESDDFQVNNKSQTSLNVSGKCDLFVGDWVADLSNPMYTNESCHVIESPQNCMKNGRPDLGYLYWRWTPQECELPKLNPNNFLNLMRNKAMAFVGDSISRNHVQSLLCILSQVEPAIEVYHDREYRSKIWKFPSHNFTLSVIWTPFLIKAIIHEDMNGVSSSLVQLHLDTLDNQWTKQFNNFDYVVIGGGKWFLKSAIYRENNTVTGCHFCPGKNLTELGFDYAYRKALQLVFNFFTNSNHNATVLFRTTTPDHFENGEWFSGGYCNRTVPFKEGQIDMVAVDSIMRGIEVEEFEKANTLLGFENGVKLKLLDTTFLSLLRPDGHPGPYRQFQPFARDENGKVQNDCLHWCLPGPIDSWNDIVMEMLVNGQ